MNERKELKPYINKAPVPNPDAPPLGTKYGMMDPLTEPMSDEERIQHITNIILVINTEERAKQLAIILTDLVNRSK